MQQTEIENIKIQTKITRNETKQQQEKFLRVEYMAQHANTGATKHHQQQRRQRLYTDDDDEGDDYGNFRRQIKKYKRMCH